MKKIAMMVLYGYLLAGATACTVGPNYHKPDMPVGKGWSEKQAAGQIGQHEWWRGLHDATLDRLVNGALAGNPDWQAARDRIRQARAQRDAVQSALAPQLGAMGYVNALRQTENGIMPLKQFPIIPRDANIYDAEFDASWEIDLFGGLRRRVEAARAQQAASVASAQDLRESLIAEVVRDYLTLRGQQHELKALQHQLSVVDAQCELLRQRVASGDVAAYLLDAALQQREQMAASLPGMQAGLRAQAMALAVLEGELPESELGLLNSSAGWPVLMPFPVGERADVLRRRPDVRVAERQLAAATADIGVATDEWFPHLILNASAGYQALQPGQLWQSSSQTGSIMPLISWQILNGGKVRADIHAAKAQQDIAAKAYVKTVLAALDDAEQALSNYHQMLDSVRHQELAFAAAQRAADRADQRFQAGDTNRQDMLSAQLALDDAQLLLAQARTEAAVDMVALRKALGGA
jgi:NodT family efflux transporter outer membrane factor (OMF) lipoprotein